jgi:hypothetical protein
VEALLKTVKPSGPPTTSLTVRPLLTIVALPAVDPSLKLVKPPSSPLAVAPALVIVAFPPFDCPSKDVRPNPPTSVPISATPLLFTIVALPAVDVSLNTVEPPAEPLTVPPLLVIAALPAVEALEKTSRRRVHR